MPVTGTATIFCEVQRMNIGEKTGIITAIVGIMYTVLAMNIQKASVGNPYEPMIFPVMLGILLTVLGVLVFIGEYRKNAKAKGNKEKIGISAYEIKMIAYICAVCILYGLLFEKIGYVLATTLFMAGLLFAFNGTKKWLVNLTVAVGFSAAIYFCFSHVFSIPLPKLPFFNI